MKRRSLILMVLIVLLPVGLLTWLGSRIARDEQLMTQRRFQSLMEQRLQDINRDVGSHFAETERRLQQITSIDEFDLTSLREVIRTEPQVTQLFVLSPNGALMYPNPTDSLNETEVSFLRRAAQMFSGQDLQNAVALAEAGIQEDFAPSVVNKPEIAAVPEPPFGSQEPQLAARSGSQTRSSDAPAAAASVPQPLDANAAFGKAMVAGEMAPANALVEANDALVAGNDLMQAPADAKLDSAELDSALPSARSQTAAELLSPEEVQAAPQPNPSQPYSLPADTANGGFAFQGNRMPSEVLQQQQAGGNDLQTSPMTSNGWFVWYWDRGLNLIYWQRRPSGHIVGALLERARWIADLISWLPETDPVSANSLNSSAQLKTSFRVISSAQEVIYQWGGEPEKGSPALCEIPLATPLDSWRLLCFVSNNELVAGAGRSAQFTLVTGLIAFTLTLTALAWFLYRDYSRDMREANQQVSFVNQVSHELKTPLTNIRLYAELLERDLEQVAADLSERPRRRLDIITSEAQRLSRLIGNVLTFASQQRKNLQLNAVSVNILELVQQIADRFAPSLNDHGIVVSVVGDKSPSLMVDPDFVEQILGNLISNVEKYSASGKSMSVQVAVGAAEAVIDVIDAGPGIPAAQRADVFRPFSRLSNDLRASSGTGIGLSIARDLARLHGGDLLLKESATGCWFQVRLRSIGDSTASGE